MRPYSHPIVQAMPLHSCTKLDGVPASRAVWYGHGDSPTAEKTAEENPSRCEATDGEPEPEVGALGTKITPAGEEIAKSNKVQSPIRADSSSPINPERGVVFQSRSPPIAPLANSSQRQARASAGRWNNTTGQTSTGG